MIGLYFVGDDVDGIRTVVNAKTSQISDVLINGVFAFETVILY